MVRACLHYRRFVSNVASECADWLQSVNYIMSKTNPTGAVEVKGEHEEISKAF